MGLGFDPDTDVPDLSGKVILITGGKSPILSNPMNKN